MHILYLLYTQFLELIINYNYSTITTPYFYFLSIVSHFVILRHYPFQKPKNSEDLSAKLEKTRQGTVLKKRDRGPKNATGDGSLSHCITIYNSSIRFYCTSFILSSGAPQMGQTLGQVSPENVYPHEVHV